MSDLTKTQLDEFEEAARQVETGNDPGMPKESLAVMGRSKSVPVKPA